MDKLTPEEIAAVELIIDRARIKLMQTELSFFGHILLQLKQEYNGQEHGISTVAVSVDTIFYNLNYIHKNVKNTNDMVFIFMHEIMHLVLDHLDKKRIKDRDMLVWNYAGDHVINLDLFASGFTYSGHEHILKDRAFIGKTTEEVYDILIKDKPDDPGCGCDAWVDVIPGDGDEEIEAVKDMVISAYNSHVLANGTDDGIPNSVRTMMDELKNPILPWESLLMKYIGEVTQNDFSWNKLNLPFLPEFYIPTLHDESLSKIDFAIDVSGSIDAKAFNKFINEIKNILLLHNITTIGIYQFSTVTISYDVVSDLEELDKIKFKGGGGTDIKHTLEQASRSDGVALFIITDGYMNLQLTPLHKPTVWCVYNNKRFNAPFGETILFDKYI
jgi:predicted metal-dependent peptidase